MAPERRRVSRDSAWLADEEAAEEAAGSALDFALVGIDFLAEDGSSLDFDHVPGLDRTLLDPHGTWIAGPAALPPETHGARAGRLQLAFRVPAPATRITVTLRSWRNSAPFAVSEARLAQGTDLAPSPALIPRARHRLGRQPKFAAPGVLGELGGPDPGDRGPAAQPAHAGSTTVAVPEMWSPRLSFAVTAIVTAPMGREQQARM